MSLKHHGKREVLQLINQMEECFDRPFVFDLDKVEPRRGRAASAITPGHWFYGEKKVQVPSWGSTHFECCHVWL